MTCRTLELDGGVAIVCSRGERRSTARCSACKAAPHTLLCDFDKPNGKTCDAKLCRGCAVAIGPDRDLCPKHDKLARGITELAPVPARSSLRARGKQLGAELGRAMGIAPHEQLELRIAKQPTCLECLRRGYHLVACVHNAPAVACAAADGACSVHGEPLVCAHACARGACATGCEDLTDHELRRPA